MRNPLVIVFGVTCVLCVWIIWLTRTIDDNERERRWEDIRAHGGHFRSPPPSIHDIELSPEEFEIEGFIHWNSTPDRILKVRPKLRGRSVWVLDHSTPGRIYFRNPEKKRRGRLRDLSLLIKYYIHLNEMSKGAKLTVAATDWATQDQVIAQLNQGADGFCTKIFYFGPSSEVEKIMIDGDKFDSYFIVIDEIKVGLGEVRLWDQLEDERCID